MNKYDNQKKGKWGGRWDLNPRQPESQSGALPTELRPPLECENIKSYL